MFEQVFDELAKRFGFDKELFCVIQLGIAFMLVFVGFDAQAFIAENALHSIAFLHPGRINNNAGYYGWVILI